MCAFPAALLLLVSLDLLAPQLTLPVPWTSKAPLSVGQLCSHSVTLLPERLDLGGGRVEGTRTLANRLCPRHLRTNVGGDKINHEISSQTAASDGRLSCFTQTGFRILLYRTLWSEILHKSP